jgi:DNA-binding IclR family transcriptional regulator
MLGYSNKKMNRVISDLKRCGYLTHTPEGYAVSGQIMQRGAK